MFKGLKTFLELNTNTIMNTKLQSAPLCLYDER